ncbi:MAG: hypothetical protein IKC13_01525 [Elusimicrobiaceae bacterium]|nr:hypothetical protein [Elusimicrobiaceae bacterium]
MKGTNSKFYRFFTYACLLFIGAGILARFLMLGNGYEYDELFTAVTANPQVSLPFIWKTYLMPDVHPPLYNLLMWVYTHFVPYGPELWLRLPSVFFGVLGMVLAWLLFPKHYGKTAKLLFISFLSCCFWLAFYTQHARAYGLIFCISVPFTYLFLNFSHAMRKGKNISAKNWWLYGFLGLSLCWSHYFGAMAFGFYSCLLLAQAWYYKRNFWPVLWVSVAVTLLFLPWAVPNILYNISDKKFSGNWWANGQTAASILPNLLEFFFGNHFFYILLVGLLCVTLFLRYKRYKQGKPNVFLPDMVLLLLVQMLMLGAVFVILTKMYLFFGRYFIPILPALFLGFALCMAPYVRKSKCLALLVLVYLMSNVLFGYFLHKYASARLYAGAKGSMEFYRDYAPEKELFVIAIEAFPPASSQAMYSFYPNYVFGMNAKVTAVYQLPFKEQLEVLERSEKAFIWMPHCSPYKLRSISLLWNRAIGIEGYLGTSCILRVAPYGQITPPKEWGNDVVPEKVPLEKQKDGTMDFPQVWKDMEERSQSFHNKLKF